MSDQLPEEMERVLKFIRPSHKIVASANFKDRVMTKLMEENTAMKKHGFKTILRLAAVGALAALFIIGLSFAGWFGKGPAPVSAQSLLAQSVKAMSNLRAIHITARMRTLPRDNFEQIGLDEDFQPIEMWKQFSNPPRWRIEKPGRVVVMDGKSAFLWIKPDIAVKAGPNAGFVEWLKPLLDADQVLDTELQRVQQQRSELAVREDNTHMLVTIKSKAQGDFTHDWVKNKSIQESDNSRIYRFDARTKRLKGLQVSVKDVVVFEITGIEYDSPIDPALFSLALPPGVVAEEPAESQLQPVPGQSQMTARDAAEAFFQGCANQDWDKVKPLLPLSSFLLGVKGEYGGLQVISLGEAFQSGDYRGWFVPYEIKLKSGRVKKHNLAIRNDNPAKRWLVDGGF